MKCDDQQGWLMNSVLFRVQPSQMNASKHCLTIGTEVQLFLLDLRAAFFTGDHNIL